MIQFVRPTISVSQWGRTSLRIDSFEVVTTCVDGRRTQRVPRSFVASASGIKMYGHHQQARQDVVTINDQDVWS